MSTADVLRAARGLLAQPGVWAKGSDNEEDGIRAGQACAFIAIADMSDVFSDARNDAVDALIRATGVETDETGYLGGLFEWNDAPERTLDEVLAAFDKAIAKEEVNA